MLKIWKDFATCNYLAYFSLNFCFIQKQNDMYFI